MNTSILRTLLPPVALMLVNFVLSSIPGVPTERPNVLLLVPPALQNLLHIPFFALLAWLWWRALVTLRQPPTRALVLAVLITLLWGILDEIHQYFVPGRFASLTDLAFNGAGALLAAFLIRWQAARK